MFYTAASIWGLVALRLSDEEILPFNYSYYAAELEVTCCNDLSSLKQILDLLVSGITSCICNDKFKLRGT